MYMDFTENIDNDINILYKTLKSHGVYNLDERIFYNGISNSFTDFIKSLTGTNIKSLSPRIIQKLKNRYIIENKSKYNWKKIFVNKSKFLLSPRSPVSPIVPSGPSGPNGPNNLKFLK